MLCRNPINKRCPKCRQDLPEASGFIKLYFGIAANAHEEQETSQEIEALLDESALCKQKIDFMFQEMNRNVNCSNF